MSAPTQPENDLAAPAADDGIASFTQVLAYTLAARNIAIANHLLHLKAALNASDVDSRKTATEAMQKAQAEADSAEEAYQAALRAEAAFRRALTNSAAGLDAEAEGGYKQSEQALESAASSLGNFAAYAEQESRAGSPQLQAAMTHNGGEWRSPSMLAKGLKAISEQISAFAVRVAATPARLADAGSKSAQALMDAVTREATRMGRGLTAALDRVEGLVDRVKATEQFWGAIDRAAAAVDSVEQRTIDGVAKLRSSVVNGSRATARAVAAPIEAATTATRVHVTAAIKTVAAAASAVSKTYADQVQAARAGAERADAATDDAQPDAEAFVAERPRG